MELGGGGGTYTGFTGAGAAAGRAANSVINPLSARTVRGPAPSPCNFSTVRASSLSSSLIFLTNSATLTSSCLSLIEDSMKLTSSATVIFICAFAATATAANKQKWRKKRVIK